LILEVSLSFQCRATALSQSGMVITVDECSLGLTQVGLTHPATI